MEANTLDSKNRVVNQLIAELNSTDTKVSVKKVKQTSRKAFCKVNVGEAKWKILLHLRDAVPVLLLLLVLSIGGSYA